MNRVFHKLDGSHGVWQPEEGFRFGADALLLAGALRYRDGERLCELGTGCGVIPVLLGMRRPPAVIYAVEIQKELAALARENAEQNGFDGWIRVVEGDLKNAASLLPEKVDLVFSNPPYRKADQGGAPTPERHEVLCGIGDVCRAAAGILTGKGRFAVIYPTERLADLFVSLRQADLEPKELLPITPVRDGAARLAVVTARKGARPSLTALPAFALREKDGTESREMRALYETGVAEVTK